MKWMWLVAALPFMLMLMMFYAIWAVPSWSNTVSLLPCVMVLAGALLTGLYVLGVVFAGWWRGAYTLKRADILAATLFASLDVLIPSTLVVLLLLLLRSIKKSGGLIPFL
jgi:hypothetical protein